MPLGKVSHRRLLPVPAFLPEPEHEPPQLPGKAPLGLWGSALDAALGLFTLKTAFLGVTKASKRQSE